MEQSNNAFWQGITIAIPTYRRKEVLLNTIEYLLQSEGPEIEILILDQTERHQDIINNQLDNLMKADKIVWIRLPYPSIPHAMNMGLTRAKYEIILFLDDDIIPSENLIKAHYKAHIRGNNTIVAGQVLQPGEETVSYDNKNGVFQFASDRRQFVSEVIGCNFSVRRKLAIDLGGFDENFVGVAFRFEAEFCDRALAVQEKIIFEPDAAIRHLRVKDGGTRSYGQHLKTITPHHSVGAYYYFLRSERIRNRWLRICIQPLRAVRTRFHFFHPWWIPVVLAAQVSGFLWALKLFKDGPKTMKRN